MGFQVSPGVQAVEVDLTAIVPSISTTDGGFVGVFRWGPLNEIVLVGNEEELVNKFGKPDSTSATSFFSCANFLAYGNKLRVVRVASTLTTTGIVGGTASSSGTAVTGSATTWLSLNLRPGDSITGSGQTKTIVSVGSNTAIVTDTAFSPALSSTAVTFSRYDGTLNASAEGNGLLIKNDDDYVVNYANGQSSYYGLWAAKYPGVLGNSLKVSICPSSSAYQQTLTGTTVAASGTTLTGVGTSFTTQLAVGSIVKDPTTLQEKVIATVSSDTSATVTVAYTAPVSAISGWTAKWQYANVVGQPPGTSDYVSGKGGSNDELHVLVIDEDGEISGVRGTVLEKHAFLSKASDAKSNDGATTYYPEAISRASKYVRWLDHVSTGSNWGSVASGTTFTDVKLPRSDSLSGGKDVNTGASVESAKLLGLDKFANAETVDIALLFLGEATTAVATHAINNIAEVRKDCIVFISPEQTDVVNNSGNEVTDSITFRNTLPSSSYAVMDSGWKYQYDKYNDGYKWIPLNGDIAGLCARTDTEADPWYSPAGFNRGNIKNVIKLAYSPYKAQRDDLYLAGVNPVISQAGQGTVLFGDKTLLSKPSAFDRINVRRLFIILEKSISKAAKSTLFEINDSFTRASFRNLVEPFLRDVQGRRGIYDFKVVCDSTNNTPEVIDRNEFRGAILIKPARSINYITLSFVAVRSGVEFSELVGAGF